MDRQGMRKKNGTSQRKDDGTLDRIKSDREGGKHSIVNKKNTKRSQYSTGTGVLMCGKAFLLTASVTASPGAEQNRSRGTPGFENTLQTHPSQRLDPRCSLLKGLREEKGATLDLNTFLIALSGACWFGS